MSKHRRQRRYRKTVIAAVAITAVGVPSVAMACMDRPGDTGGEHARWNKASARHHHWWKGSWSPSPSATATSSPSATASAKPTATAPATKAPATTTAAKPSATATTPAATASASGPTAQVVQLVNSERSKAGCSPLTVNAKLTKAAQAHSEDMAAHRTMSHTGSDGSSPGDRITAAGYSWSMYGENVAYGYSTPQSVMTAWMNSPGHRANILNCSFKEIGVGYAGPGDYWTQDFGTAR